MSTIYLHNKKCSDDTDHCQKGSVTGVSSKLNEYRSSIKTVSDQYSHICIRPVRVGLIQIRIYKSVSDPLPNVSLCWVFRIWVPLSCENGASRQPIFPNGKCLPRTMLCTNDERGAMTPLSFCLQDHLSVHPPNAIRHAMTYLSFEAHRSPPAKRCRPFPSNFWHQNTPQKEHSPAVWPFSK